MIMHYCIIVILTVVNLLECREDFRIHSVNMSDNSQKMSIVGRRIKNQYSFKLITNFIDNGYVARAHFVQQINSTGWGHLLVQSSEVYPDELQAYFSGVVESLISRPLIAAHWHNSFDGHCVDKSLNCTILSNYLKENFLSLIEKTRNRNGFLKMIRLLLWQAKGIQDGFDGNWKNNSTEINEQYLVTMKDQLLQLYLIQINGDLFDMPDILKGSNYYPEFVRKFSWANSRCSAIIKYVRGIIYSSHVAWYDYQWMLRVTKLYDFPYRVNANEKSSAIVPGRKLSFSSYPGVIASMDDFYITSAGLVTIETTIGNHNKSLYGPLKYLAADIVFEFARVQASNRISRTGEQWAKLFSRFNSGTYNNQWMIVNYNLMKNHHDGERIPDGVLYIAEQIPSLVVYQDVTDYLRSQSYWPSYNLPYNKIIWAVGDFQSQVEKKGYFADYNKCPRAQIFRSRAPHVNDELALMRLMRYNDYKHDPFAWCNSNPPYNAEFGISSRFDLNLPNVSYPCGGGFGLFGGYDMKYTTSDLMKTMTFIGISGPTNDQQPVFDWTKFKDSKARHQMHPERFDFPPVKTPFS